MSASICRIAAPLRRTGHGKPLSSALLVVGIVLAPCGGDDSNQATSSSVDSASGGLDAFCGSVVPVLQTEPVGTDDPAGPVDGVASQMETIVQEAESLSDEDRRLLLTLVEEVNEDLDAARQGEADNGWSSVPVVNMVTSLCGSDDLIGWTVQP